MKFILLNSFRDNVKTLPWSHFLPSKSSTVRYSCISKSSYSETLVKHPVHYSDFVLLYIHCLVWWILHHSSRQWTNQWKGNSKKFQLLVKSFLMVENKIFLKLRMFSDQSCVNWTETVHGTLHFLFLLSPVVWNMCEKLHYESVYSKELHNGQEYYWPTVYRAGAAVVSTITSVIRINFKI